MDVLAHGLWTNVMYKAIPQVRHNRKIVLWGIALGVLPDLVSFVPVFLELFYKIITKSASFGSGRPDFDSFGFGQYAAASYNYTHSLVVWIIAVALAFAVYRKFPWILLGWGLHIGIDIFSHTKEFYATPFLFPLSDFKVSAVPWSHPVFMIVNYGLLFIMYLFVIPKFSNKKSANVIASEETQDVSKRDNL